MYEFKDKEGRSWTVPEITLRTVMRMNSEIGVEINDVIAEGHLWSQTDAAMIAVGSMLWLLCEGQHGIDEDAFFNGFDLDSFKAAQGVVAQRIVDFSPSERRDQIRTMIDQMIQAGKLEVEAIAAQQDIVEKTLSDPDLLKNALSSQEKQELPTQDPTASDISGVSQKEDGSTPQT